MGYLYYTDRFAYGGGSQNGGHDWHEFDQFDTPIIRENTPECGNCKNLANQAILAVDMLVAEWYLNGNAYDNTGFIDTNVSDVSSFANWLYENTIPYLDLRDTLDRIKDCGMKDPHKTWADYENILFELAEKVYDPNFIVPAKQRNVKGSIRDCKGPFKYEETEKEEPDL